MAQLSIRMYPDPVLREPAAPVAEIDEDVRKLVEDMTQTMLAANGIGLAAPQIGVQRRVLVYRTGEEDELHVVVNPQIVSSSGEIVADEGCLSIPGLVYPVARAEVVAVSGRDAEGRPLDYEARDLEARVIQHEVDHLDGVLFLDRISKSERREALRIVRERALLGAVAPASDKPAVRI